LIFFLSVILLFQTVTFSPIALGQNLPGDNQIPSWFKNIIKWWKEEKLSDKEIINVMENLLDREIIKLDSTKIKSGTAIPETKFFLPPNKEGVKIPSYAKNTFVSWEEGSVADSDVANTIKFLIEANIIFTPTFSPDKPRPLAAVIDQLYDLIPNKKYQQKSLEYLENAGFDVDVYTTEDITVDFFKKLPSMNYEFIIFRTHSLEVAHLGNSTFLFTGEKYDIDKYIFEQLSGQVHRALPISDQYSEDVIEEAIANPDAMYFTIGSKLIDELMIGEFPQSVIIIGGCESVRNPDLAKSLVLRGASSVIGWDRSINSMENDKVMLALLEEALINKTGMYDAIGSVMDRYGENLQYSSELFYFQDKR
jgi:hypothetical protein